MAIKAVLFDIGGVLLTLGEDVYRQEVARRLGLGDALPDAYEAAIPALQRGEVDEVEVWWELSGQTVPLTTFDDAFRNNFPPVPDMLAFAAELRQRGLQTPILSNTQASHVAVLRQMGFLDDFGPVFMSCEIGHRKPEQAAFAHVLEQIGLPGEQVVYLDDFPEYVAAAAELGIHGIVHSGDVAATRAKVEALLG